MTEFQFVRFCRHLHISKWPSRQLGKIERKIRLIDEAIAKDPRPMHQLLNKRSLLVKEYKHIISTASSHKTSISPKIKLPFCHHQNKHELSYILNGDSEWAIKRHGPRSMHLEHFKSSGTIFLSLMRQINEHNFVLVTYPRLWSLFVIFQTTEASTCLTSSNGCWPPY